MSHGGPCCCRLDLSINYYWCGGNLQSRSCPKSPTWSPKAVSTLFWPKFRTCAKSKPQRSSLVEHNWYHKPGQHLLSTKQYCLSKSETINSLTNHHSLVPHLGCHGTPSSQSAHQVDSSCLLKVTGETQLSFSSHNYGNREFLFEGLVVENLGVKYWQSCPLWRLMTSRSAKCQVILRDGTIYVYGPQAPPSQLSASPPVISCYG